MANKTLQTFNDKLIEIGLIQPTQSVFSTFEFIIDEGGMYIFVTTDVPLSLSQVPLMEVTVNGLRVDHAVTELSAPTTIRLSVYGIYISTDVVKVTLDNRDKTVLRALDDIPLKSFRSELVTYTILS